MKTHVNIDGVTLTRTQVEKALQELNKPTYVGGDIVSTNFGGKKRYLLVDRETNIGELIRSWYSNVIQTNHVLAIGLDNGSAYNFDPSAITGKVSVS